MSKKKSMLGLYTLALGAMAFDPSTNQIYRETEPKETDEERLSRIKSATIKRYIKSGLKEFEYSGGSVFALNQKSADKKAKKLGII